MTPVYLVLALFTTMLGAFTDIRSGCVKNSLLLTVLTIWLLLTVSEFSVLHSSSTPLFLLTINVIFAVIVSVMFYLTDIWAPGDCKLYIVITLIFPMRAYAVREGNIFPALNFVIYAFALGYVFLLAMTFARRTSRRITVKPNLNAKHAASVMANAGTISFLNILLNICAPKFYYANQMLCISASVVLICLLQRNADTARKVIGFTGLLCFLLQSVLRCALLNACLGLAESLVIASAIEYINTRTRANTYREIPGEEVRPGMILSFATLWAMRKYTDPELPRTTTENRRSRLTQRQAEAVKTWCRNAGCNAVIVEMMPFAPFIAASVAIEVLLFLLLGR